MQSANGRLWAFDDNGLQCVAPIQLLLEFNALILCNRPDPGFGGLAVLFAVSGIPKELRALAAPAELAPAPGTATFLVPDEHGDDRFGLNAFSRVNLHSLVRPTHVLTRPKRIFGNHPVLCA